jgi:hypothetical protein
MLANSRQDFSGVFRGDSVKKKARPRGWLSLGAITRFSSIIWAHRGRTQACLVVVQLLPEALWFLATKPCGVCTGTLEREQHGFNSSHGSNLSAW